MPMLAAEELSNWSPRVLSEHVLLALRAIAGAVTITATRLGVGSWRPAPTPLARDGDDTAITNVNGNAARLHWALSQTHMGK
jgi:hypothetical protein